MNIVMADADTQTIELARHALREYGYTVTAARDGLQAIRRWEADQPDAVIVNLRLPLSDGFEVCRTIRRRSKTPVIMVGDLPTDDDAVRAFEAGADDFIGRPFSHRQLAMRL